MAIGGSNLGYFLIYSVRNFKSDLSQCQTAILDLGTERHRLFAGFVALPVNSFGIVG